MTTRETPPDTYSLKAAATACGVSESTVRRNRDKLRQHGAAQTATGWVIPRTALIAAGLMTAPHNTPTVAPPETHRDTPSNAELVAVLHELAEAKADAREWRARAEERERERVELIRRAEAAEATAREATASATALALTVRSLEASSAHEGGIGPQDGAAPATEPVSQEPPRRTSRRFPWRR